MGSNAAYAPPPPEEAIELGDSQAGEARFEYVRADGTRETAQSIEAVIDRCPVLGRIAAENFDDAKMLIELEAEIKPPASPVPEEVLARPPEAVQEQIRKKPEEPKTIPDDESKKAKKSLIATEEAQSEKPASPITVVHHKPEKLNKNHEKVKKKPGGTQAAEAIGAPQDKKDSGGGGPSKVKQIEFESLPDAQLPTIDDLTVGKYGARFGILAEKHDKHTFNSADGAQSPDGTIAIQEEVADSKRRNAAASVTVSAEELKAGESHAIVHESHFSEEQARQNYQRVYEEAKQAESAAPKPEVAANSTLTESSPGQITNTSGFESIAKAGYAGVQGQNLSDSRESAKSNEPLADIEEEGVTQPSFAKEDFASKLYYNTEAVPEPYLDGTDPTSPDSARLESGHIATADNSAYMEVSMPWEKPEPDMEDAHSNSVDLIRANARLSEKPMTPAGLEVEAVVTHAKLIEVIRAQIVKPEDRDGSEIKPQVAEEQIELLEDGEALSNAETETAEGQGEIFDDTENSKSFSDKVEEAKSENEKVDIDKVKALAEDEAPAEEALAELACVFKEISVKKENKPLQKLVNEISDEIISKPAANKTESGDPATPEISLAMTRKLLELLRSVGYQNPKRALLEMVSRHDTDYLIEAISYLNQVAHESEHERSSNGRFHLFVRHTEDQINERLAYASQALIKLIQVRDEIPAMVGEINAQIAEYEKV